MIRISGNYTFEASREEVWPRIFDPGSMLSLIPGCEKMELIGEDEYFGQIHLGVASISGTYETYVRVIESDPPRYCCMKVQIEGTSGVIQGQAVFSLEAMDQSSVLHYEADAMITGALSKLNPRFIEGTVHALIQLGLARLNKQLRAKTESDYQSTSLSS